MCTIRVNTHQVEYILRYRTDGSQVIFAVFSIIPQRS